MSNDSPRKPEPQPGIDHCSEFVRAGFGSGWQRYCSRKPLPETGRCRQHSGKAPKWLKSGTGARAPR